VNGVYGYIPLLLFIGVVEHMGLIHLNAGRHWSVRSVGFCRVLLDKKYMEESIIHE
jgi:hypothetical protein